jgi:hypothetical protein
MAGASEEATAGPEAAEAGSVGGTAAELELEELVGATSTGAVFGVFETIAVAVPVGCKPSNKFV